MTPSWTSTFLARWTALSFPRLGVQSRRNRRESGTGSASPAAARHRTRCSTLRRSSCASGGVDAGRVGRVIAGTLMKPRSASARSFQRANVGEPPELQDAPRDVPGEEFREAQRPQLAMVMAKDPDAPVVAPHMRPAPVAIQRAEEAATIHAHWVDAPRARTGPPRKGRARPTRRASRTARVNVGGNPWR